MLLPIYLSLFSNLLFPFGRNVALGHRQCAEAWLSASRLGKCNVKGCLLFRPSIVEEER